MSRQISKILFFVLIAFVGAISFCVSAYLFLSRSKDTYPSDHWPSVEALKFSLATQKTIPDRSSYNYELPLSKYPSNYEVIEDQVLGRNMNYDEKVLLLRDGAFSADVSEENLTDFLKNISKVDATILLDDNLLLSDLILQNIELNGLLRNDAEKTLKDIYTKILDSMIAFYEKTEDESLKVLLYTNALKIFQSLYFIDSSVAIPEILKNDFQPDLSTSYKLDILEKPNLGLLAWIVKENRLENEWNFAFSAFTFVDGISPIPDLSVVDELILGSDAQVSPEDLLSPEFLESYSTLADEDLPAQDCLNHTGLDRAAAFGLSYAKELGGNEISDCGYLKTSASFVDETNSLLFSFSENSDCADIVCGRDFFKKNSLNNFLSATEFQKFSDKNDLQEDSELSIKNNLVLQSSVNSEFADVAYFWKSYANNSAYTEFVSEEFRDKAKTLEDDSILLKIFIPSSKEYQKQLSSYLSDITKRVDLKESSNKLRIDLIVLNLNNNLEIVVRPYFEYQENSITPEYLQTVVNDNNFDEDYDVVRTAQSKNSVRVPVLMYHHIENYAGTDSTKRFYVSPETFEQQVAYLISKNYKVLTIDEFYDILKSGKNPAQKSILLTFDDGKRDNYTNAYPILKKYGVPGVFYITTNTTGIISAELKEMADNGMIIDSHSATHIDLKVEEDEEKLWYEINTSRYILEARTGYTVKSFAYPGCVASQKTFEYVAATGYKVAFSCGDTIDLYFRNRLSLSRMHAYDSMDNFKKILSGYFEIPTVY